MAKPDKKIFELAIEKLRVLPEEVLFVDDKAGHLNGALQVGMRTVLFEDTDDAIKEIRQLIGILE